MSDLSSLGYPQGYHLGSSFILWSIFIIVVAILGVGLYLNARKSALINVKQMLRAKSFVYICISIEYSLIQVTVFFPDIFLQFYFSGLVIYTFSSTLYFYYWEKNLTRIKRIPTISVGAGTIVALFALTTSIFFPDLPNFLWDFLIFTVLSLGTVAIVLYVYLIYVFSRNVRGGLTTTIGWAWIGGMVLIMVALFFEHPPGVKIFSEFIVLYIIQIVFMAGLMMTYYGITKLFTQISSFYAHTQRCAVHLGTIEKGTPIHYCSSCGIVYCETCFNQVIMKDGCWNCREEADFEIEKEQDIAQVLEQDKPDKRKKPPEKETSSSPKLKRN